MTRKNGKKGMKKLCKVSSLTFEEAARTDYQTWKIIVIDKIMCNCTCLSTTQVKVSVRSAIFISAPFDQKNCHVSNCITRARRAKKIFVATVEWEDIKYERASDSFIHLQIKTNFLGSRYLTQLFPSANSFV